MTHSETHRHASADNLKTLDEVFDDLVEAVKHAEDVERERDVIAHDLHATKSRLAECERILGAIMARRVGGARIDREEWDAAPRVAWSWVDDVCGVWVEGER